MPWLRPCKLPKDRHLEFPTHRRIKEEHPGFDQALDPGRGQQHFADPPRNHRRSPPPSAHRRPALQLEGMVRVEVGAGRRGRSVPDKGRKGSLPQVLCEVATQDESRCTTRKESFATRLNKDRLVRTVEVSQVKFGVRFLGWETPCLFLAGARNRPVGSRGSNQVTRVTQLVPLLLSGWFRTPLFVLIKPRLKSMKLHVKLVGYNLDGLWHKVARLAALQRKRERRS